MNHLRYILTAALAVLLASDFQPVLAANAEYLLQVVDKETGKPCSAKISIKDSRGRVRRVPGALMIGDTAYFTGQILLEFRPDTYHFRIDCGPEYPYIEGYFELNSGDQDTRTIELRRFANLREEGWYAGNLAMEGLEKDLETLMMADDLVIGNRIVWNNKTNPLAGKPFSVDWHTFGSYRRFWPIGGEDARAGGKLWFANLTKPLPVQNLNQDYPSALFFQEDIGQTATSHTSAATPFEPDLPIWIAEGLLDSVCLLSPEIEAYPFDEKHPLHAYTEQFIQNDVTQKPRLAQDIYYRMLEAGLRIPPSAANGTLGNKAVQSRLDRVYAHTEGDFSNENWWESLAEGHVFVTNGPLLRASVEGQVPGHIFQINYGDKTEFQIGVNLATRQNIAYLEVIKNGQKEIEVSLDEYRDRRGVLPPIEFSDSGWFVVRVVTQEPTYWQMATTAPFFVQANGQKRISRGAAEFFRDWVFRRAIANQLPDGPKRAEMVGIIRSARDYWQSIVDKANVP